MKKNFTELVFILDKSGSMHNLAKDTIGGFNSMIEQQRKVEGTACVSTVLFNQESTVIHDRVDLREIRPMTGRDYVTGGSTALMDAIGDAIHHIGIIHKYARREDVPEKTLFIITTDGMENASYRYHADKIRQMVKRQQDEYGWEFIFMGANIDAVGTAANYGIKAENAVDYLADKEGTDLNFKVLNEAIGHIRVSKSLPKEWNKEIQADHAKRSRR